MDMLAAFEQLDLFTQALQRESDNSNTLFEALYKEMGQSLAFLGLSSRRHERAGARHCERMLRAQQRSTTGGQPSSHVYVLRSQ